MLQRINSDTTLFAQDARDANHRDRPYVGDPAIIPCNKAYPTRLHARSGTGMASTIEALASAA